MEQIFNQVEELTGTYPTGDNLRSAVHAIITKKHNYSHPLFNWNMVATQLILNNVDYIARTYEQNRGTTQVVLEDSCCNCGIPATDGMFNNPKNKTLYPNISDTAWMCRDCNDSIIKGYEKSRDEWCNEINQNSLY